MCRCFLGWIERMIQFFNAYAFCYVAIYGKDFRSAGHDVWDLLKVRTARRE